MRSDPPEPAPRTLIDELLAEQQSLTAVERFARQHAQDALPAQSRYYRELIPLAKPQPGEQYAFGVDLDACTGCKACVSACHSLNGLDDDELWRDVGLLHGGDAAPYQQTITTACHHCVEPACLEGCPVRAYEKDADTGIVRHLDDQCIGCQYCVLKCPYDVPKYSAKRGIVRKCDMCHSRLSANEAPACVQACPNGAITIRVVSKSDIVKHSTDGDRLLPGTFDSSYTKPTTSYTTRKPIPADARAGDARALRVEHAHWPLIVMLVLTQLAAGVFFAASALASAAPAVFAAHQGALALGGFFALQAGLAVSVLHLGRPLGAWRAFLGLRTSWMSREIFAFGGLAGISALFAFCAVWAPLARFAAPLVHATSFAALVAVYCSAMIYIDTRRPYWCREQTFVKFFGTALLLGASAVAWLLGDASFALAALLLRTALLGWEFRALRAALHDDSSDLHRPALTMVALMRTVLIVRVALFVGATSAGLFGLLGPALSAGPAAALALVLTLLGQVAERYLFFTAVVAPRMPGIP